MKGGWRTPTFMLSEADYLPAGSFSHRREKHCPHVAVAGLLIIEAAVYFLSFSASFA